MIGFVRRGVRGRLLVVFALWTIVASGVFLCAPVVIGAASSRAAAADAPPHTARVCQDDIAAGVLQSTGAEAFLQLTVPAGAHVNIYGHIFLLSADVNGQYRTKFKLDQLDGDSSLNMTGEFEGGYYFFGQLNSHSVGWEFDNTGGERTATVRLSHEISNVLGWSLQVSYGSAPRPIDCGPVSSGESYGPNIALVNPCPAEGQCADPVSTRSGNWHMPLPGLTVPGRGPGLSFEIAYNSLAASVAGKAGNGWSTTLDMALKVQQQRITDRCSRDGLDGHVLPSGRRLGGTSSVQCRADREHRWDVHL